MRIKIDRFFIKRFVIVSILFLIACIIPYFSSNYIKNHYKPPVVNDFFWNFLPYAPIITISEIIILLSVVYLFYWAYKKNLNYINYAVFLWASFQIIRAGLIILTPLGFPESYDGLSPIGEGNIFAFGAFPSGHLAYPFITYLITRKKFVLFLTAIGTLALLISRAHYSIDIIGAFLLGYCLYHLAEHNLKKYFFKDEKTST